MRLLCAAVLLAVSTASAQNVSCLLSGTLQDSSHAVIPGAEVKVVSELTGFVRLTRTNAEGFFSLPDLTPSTFTIAIAAAGFKTHTQSGVTARSGEQRSLGLIEMQVGAVGESVEVTAEVAAVMTASGERAAVLTDKDMETLATRSRDVMDAVALLPGVVDLNDTRESASYYGSQSVYIQGGRDNQKNVTVDGVTNVEIGDSTAMRTMLAMDSVSEVKVLMSNYAAEYGRNSGGTVSVITKGGGKQFHATAGWFHRHEQFSANDYFNNRNGLGRSPYRFNTFTGTLGGPLYIPGRFNRDRSKLFFFYSQEIQSQLVNNGSRTITVPTALERSGDFSQTRDINGKLITIYDSQANQTPFPGNVIPAGRLSTIGKRILGMFPAPNYVDPSPSRRYQWNYISASSSPHPRDNEVARIDYSPRANVQIYGRYNRYWDQASNYYSGSVNYPLVPVTTQFPGRGATLHGTVTLSPSLFSESIFGMTQNYYRYFPEDLNAVTRKGTGIDIPAWFGADNPTGMLPNMTFGGVANAVNPTMDARISSYMNNTHYNPTYSFVENVSKVYQSHTLKFGMYVEHATATPFAATNVRGSVAFAVDRTNPLDSNYAFSNALLGVYQNYQESTGQPVVHLKFQNVDWFAQDDWRVRPGLFFNFGMRFSNAPPMWDELQQQSTFIASLYDAAKAPILLRPTLDKGVKAAFDPRNGTLYNGVLIGTFVPGVGDPADGMATVGKNGYPRSLYTTSPVTVGPRFGFAWAPFSNGRTSVRGGGGVFFNRYGMVSGNMHTIAANPPNVYTPGVYFGTLESLGQLSGKGILAPTASMYAMTGEQPQTATYNFSFGVQQQLGHRSVLDLSYAGSIARHLWSLRNINPVPAGAQFLDLHPENRDLSTTASALSANFLRPYQGWGDILNYDFGGSSNYNALQSSFTQRFGRGFVGINYTFSKVLGVASTDTTSTSPFFPARDRNYGPLNYDRPHVFSVRFNYRLPDAGRAFGMRALGVVTDHWEVSGVGRIMSGAPFTPGLTSVDNYNFTGTPSETVRPDVLNPDADPVNRFGRPARNSFGNTGQNVLRGPGMNNWDLSIYRQIPLREGKYIQLRLESYNTLNHTQFSAVSQSPRFDAQGNQVDPLFLQPTAARAPRRLQMAIRLNW
jgi:hypothetical protein